MSITINTTVTKEETVGFCSFAFLGHTHPLEINSHTIMTPEEMFPLSPFMFIGKSECGFRTDFTMLFFCCVLWQMDLQALTEIIRAERRVTRGSLEFFCLLTRVFFFLVVPVFTFSQWVNLYPSTTFKTTDITEPKEEGFLFFFSAVSINWYQISNHDSKSYFFFLLSRLYPSSWKPLIINTQFILKPFITFFYWRINLRHLSYDNLCHQHWGKELWGLD